MVSILEPLRLVHRTHSSTKQPSDSGSSTYADRLESYYVMLAGSSKMPLWGDNTITVCKRIIGPMYIHDFVLVMY